VPLKDFDPLFDAPELPNPSADLNLLDADGIPMAQDVHNLDQAMGLITLSDSDSSEDSFS
jgi:hypothetical protein